MVYSDDNNNQNNNAAVNNFGNEFNRIIENRNGMNTDGFIQNCVNNKENYLFVYNPNGDQWYSELTGLAFSSAPHKTDETSFEKKSSRKGGLRIARRSNVGEATASDGSRNSSKPMNKKVVIFLVAYVVLIAIIIIMFSFSNFGSLGSGRNADAELQASANTQYAEQENDPYYFGKSGIIVASDNKGEVVVMNEEDTNEEYTNGFDRFCEFLDTVFGG